MTPKNTPTPAKEESIKLNQEDLDDFEYEIDHAARIATGEMATIMQDSLFKFQLAVKDKLWLLRQGKKATAAAK
jgi:hypothetical protein